MSLPPVFGQWKREVVADEIMLPRLFLAFRSPAFGTPEYYAASVCGAVLGLRNGSRLRRRLVRERQVAAEATAFTFDLAKGSDLLVVDVTARPGISAEQLEQEVAYEIDAVLRDGIDAAEVERAVALIQTSFVSSMQQAGERADRLSMFATYFGKPELDQRRSRTATRRSRPTTSIASCASGSAKTIARACSTCRATMLPASWSARAQPRRHNDRARGRKGRAASPGPAARISVSSFSTGGDLENGFELVVAPVTKLPIVTVAVVVDAGAVCDPPGREGTAQLAAKLLVEGTQTSDGAELTERFERLGATIDAEADWDAAAITMTALAEHLPAAFDLLGEVLRTPAFRPREVARLKAERIAELLQLRAEPRGLADELFSRFLYQPSSRYAQPEGGDEKSVEAIDREQLIAVLRIAVSARRTSASSSPATSASIAPRSSRAARSATGSGARRNRVIGDDLPARTQRAVHIVAKPDAPQSELRIGHVGIPRNHPDFFPVNVMNAVLGGLFNSRINLNLREAHAYTYGAFSAFDWRRQAGPFVVSTAVKSDITDAAAREVLLEIDRIRAEAISPDELSLATSYLDGVFPIRFETTAAIAAALSVLVIHGLPDDYYDRYRDRVRAITTEQILQAAQRYLHPGALQLVAVGDPAAIRAPLDQSGLRPDHACTTHWASRRHDVRRRQRGAQVRRSRKDRGQTELHRSNHRGRHRHRALSGRLDRRARHDSSSGRERGRAVPERTRRRRPAAAADQAVSLRG